MELSSQESSRTSAIQYLFLQKGKFDISDENGGGGTGMEMNLAS